MPARRRPSPGIMDGDRIWLEYRPSPPEPSRAPETPPMPAQPDKPDTRKFDALVAVCIQRLEEMERDEAQSQGLEEKDASADGAIRLCKWGSLIETTSTNSLSLYINFSLIFNRNLWQLAKLLYSRKVAMPKVREQWMEVNTAQRGWKELST
ncbi:hypothetical protein F4680DRAFT_445579 [Xylaria scruposa]|nr:hypothetical protein F4680DRAFT_445579 [Xylaria scruposa]